MVRHRHVRDVRLERGWRIWHVRNFGYFGLVGRVRIQFPQRDIWLERMERRVGLVWRDRNIRLEWDRGQRMVWSFGL